ncbi:hypothetical protein FOZ60_014749, partial [Perkinsus olseni]
MVEVAIPMRLTDRYRAGITTGRENACWAGRRWRVVRRKSTNGTAMPAILARLSLTLRRRRLARMLNIVVDVEWSREWHRLERASKLSTGAGRRIRSCRKKNLGGGSSADLEGSAEGSLGMSAARE